MERSSRHLADGKDRCWGIAVMPGATDMGPVPPLQAAPTPAPGLRALGSPGLLWEGGSVGSRHVRTGLPGRAPGMSALWGRGSSTASVTNHIPAARIQTALTGTGSSARLPGVSPRTWRGYRSTCAPPASTSPTRSTQVGLPFAEPCPWLCWLWVFMVRRRKGWGFSFPFFFFKGECS